MHAFFSDHFVLPLPFGHRFPMSKYALLHEHIAQRCPAVTLCEPLAAPDGVLALAHHPTYIQRFAGGQLSAAEQRAMGFPWSAQMVERARRSVGGTLGACRAALRDGVAVNLAGGTHHAFADRGEGFCCFNDVAVAARLMQAERRVKRVAIVDLDVHQGNGTAAILRGDPSVFTLSLHGEKNYPFTKEISDLDVALPDGTGDDAYAGALLTALGQMQAVFAADLMIFIAGADVYAGDRLGRLALTREGVARRDALVFSHALANAIPVAVVMGGGYCPDIGQIVDIHAATVKLALQHADAVAARAGASPPLV